MIAEFTESLGFIISFLVVVLVLATTTSQKFLNSFLWLVLLGMVYTNWNKIEYRIRRGLL
jgi:hypothetical protein